MLIQTPQLEAERIESLLAMSLGYFEIDSQRPMTIPSSDTFMISPSAAMPGMPSVTRKEAFFISGLEAKVRKLVTTTPEDDAANELAENVDLSKEGEENRDSP